MLKKLTFENVRFLNLDILVYFIYNIERYAPKNINNNEKVIDLVSYSHSYFDISFEKFRANPIGGTKNYPLFNYFYLNISRSRLLLDSKRKIKLKNRHILYVGFYLILEIF
ncbi:hypothetical protein SDC9_07819 [bioreactor metagenome]|uniref:Uncharacterized protein n=1 Tax=bioreactor metagenome TaxID=1076179 RepID=A0A644T5X3_9ZZZZ